MSTLPDRVTLSFPVRYTLVGARQRAYVTLPSGIEISESFAPDLTPEEATGFVEATVKRTLAEAMSAWRAGTPGNAYTADIGEGVREPPPPVDKTRATCKHCKTSFPVQVSQLQDSKGVTCPVCLYHVVFKAECP